MPLILKNWMLCFSNYKKTKQELANTKRRLETAEALLADTNEKKHQLEAERKKNAKERKALEDEIVLLRADLCNENTSLQLGCSVESEVFKKH